MRRPLDPARFNGTVIVEWNNVSAGLEIFEQGETPVIFDEGFAYVAVSAQRVGVHGFDVSPQGCGPGTRRATHRDGEGNAIGGVRVPEQAVTLTRNIGSMEESGGGLVGAWEPLPPEVLLNRYPDRATYVSAFEAAAQAAVDAGALRPGDAAESIRRANANWPESARRTVVGSRVGEPIEGRLTTRPGG